MHLMNKLFISLLFYLSICDASANDSLIALTHSKVDTIRIKAFVLLSNKYRHIDLDTAFNYIKTAERELANIEDTQDTAVGMRWFFFVINHKALYFQETDQFDSAFYYYNILIAHTKKMQNAKLTSQIYNNVGALNEQQSKYAQALEYYLKAFRLYDSINDPLMESKTLVNIGVIYYRQQEYTEALKYYEKALPLKKELNDRRGEALLYNNMGIIYYYLENYDKVLENFKRSLSIYRQLGDIRSQAMPYYNIAEIYKEQNRLKEALYYYKKAHDIEMQLGDISGQAETLSTIGYIYLDLNKPTEAIIVQKEAIRLLKKLGTPRELADALLTLSTTYELLKQHSLALQYFKQYKIQHDSINNIQKAKEIANVKEAYESEKKDNHISLLSEKNKTMEIENARQNVILVAQRRMTILSLIVVVLVLFGLIMVYRLYQQKKLSNQLLEFKNKAINRKNDEISKMVVNLEQAIGAREVFFSNATHELRTPLNIINGFTNLLTNAINNEKHSYYLKNIKNSTSHLLRLIEDILAISQMESGFLKLQYESVNLNEFIKYTISPFEILASQRSLKLEYSIDPKCPSFVKIDHLRYQQIIANLIDNAIKYTPQNGNISLTFTYANSYLKLQIEDTGLGIDSEALKDIFNRYERGSNTSKLNTIGMGLGLNITKQLAELQKGTLHVESTLGQGSIFTVTILAEQMPKATYYFGTDSKIIASKNGSFGKVLLVDDNPANLELTIDILNIYMPTLIIDVATSGTKAIEMMNKNSYHLVLLDLKMPDMNGFDVAKTMKNTGLENLPIVAISAQVNAETRQECKKLGMIGFIEKPYEPIQLINEIERVGFFTNIKNTNKTINASVKNKFIQLDEIEKLINTQIPDLLNRFNRALRNKDWDLVTTQLENLRGKLDSFETQDFKEHLNVIEKECFTTRDNSRAGEAFQQLMETWNRFSRNIQKDFKPS